MQSVVLLGVAAVWLAVIVPPLLRSRSENRPNSSVTDFRRQLSTLQRAVPTRTMVPMRGMARPLTQSPQQRPQAYGHQGQHGHPGQVRRSASFPQPGQRSHLNGGIAPRYADDRGYVERGYAHTDGMERPQRAHDGHRQMHLHRVSRREQVRRRRANVLFVLVVSVFLTGFLAATTHASLMVYGFALSFISLCGYCYKLVQIRNEETDRSYGEHSWFNAA